MVGSVLLRTRWEDNSWRILKSCRILKTNLHASPADTCSKVFAFGPYLLPVYPRKLSHPNVRLAGTHTGTCHACRTSDIPVHIPVHTAVPTYRYTYRYLPRLPVNGQGVSSLSCFQAAHKGFHEVPCRGGHTCGVYSQV